MWMKVVVVAAGLAMVLAVSGAAYQFAVAPTHVDEGVRERGSTFHSSFRVLASEDTEVGITLERGNLETFRRFKEDRAEEFSAETCTDCVEFLPGKAGGALEEKEESVRTGGDEFTRWRDVEFLYEVPEDMEPGYHVVNVVPAPDVSGGGGSVSVVSSSSFPVMFRVPGTVVRSGDIIGLRGGMSSPDRQEVVATFHNNGTVTMEVKAVFEVDTGNGTEEVGTGGMLVSPGESIELSSFVRGDPGDEFPVTATVDYGTGNVSSSGNLSPTQYASAPTGPERETELPFSTLALLLILALTTLVTWKVLRDG